jgi:hypothetical protein
MNDILKWRLRWKIDWVINYYTLIWFVTAPDGCLQYYQQATGEVKMLGYPMTPHLADLDYTVCVRSEDGAGSIVVNYLKDQNL